MSDLELIKASVDKTKEQEEEHVKQQQGLLISQQLPIVL